MTPEEHYAEAERLYGLSADVDPAADAGGWADRWMARALVHATLATCPVTLPMTAELIGHLDPEESNALEERVARALYAELGGDVWYDYLDAARAALTHYAGE